MMLTKLFNTFIKTQKIQFCKYWGSSTIVSKMNGMCTDAINKDSLSPEDKKKILDIINCKSTDLLQYSITEKRAYNLKSHRADNGPFKSLDDLVLVKGMNNKCLYKFYKSIIYGKKRGPRKITRGLVLTPKAVNDDHKKVDTVLGIHIGQDMISWSLLNRECEVLQWNYKSFPQKPKENLHTLLQTTLPIAAKLPKADRYVMQETGGDIGYQQSRKFYHAYVQQSIIGATIMSYLTTLNCKFDNTSEYVASNFFILRHHILRKIYGLIIDNEVISAQYMLQKLLHESDGFMKTKERLPNVLIRTELKDMYNALSSTYQEQISWSLLIALAFVELVVHQRTDMTVRNAK